jgi:hypothetical protein
MTQLKDKKCTIKQSMPIWYGTAAVWVCTSVRHGQGGDWVGHGVLETLRVVEVGPSGATTLVRV